MRSRLGDLPPDMKITLRPHKAGRIDTTPGELMADGRFPAWQTLDVIEFAFSRD